MTTRRRAREIVLQVLYEDDMNSTREPQSATTFLEKRLLKNKPLVRFGEGLLEGVRTHLKEIDSMLGKHAANWAVKRMATIDRNVLRLAVYEIMWADVPGRVVINEAIELAKRYGHHNSGPFVNGILDRVLKEKDSPVALTAEVPSVEVGGVCLEDSLANKIGTAEESTVVADAE